MSAADISNSVIYLDNAATTPCDPRVVEAMRPYWMGNFGNPSSPHIMGQLAHQVIEDSRNVILTTLNGAGDFLFTSGSTESNNLGIYSLLKHVKEMLGKRKVLCLSTEHKSVLNAVIYFGSAMTMTVEFIPVLKNGLIDMNWFKTAIDSTVGAVVVQLANSETGVIQDLNSISKIAHKFGAKCFSDITQVIGKAKVDLATLGADYVSFTAHKFYGPKGVGALYVASGSQISPLIFGGGQEKGRRPGTENVPGIVGLTEALKISVDELEENSVHIGKLRESLWKSLKKVGYIYWNGMQAPLLPSHLNVTISAVNAQDLMLRVRNVAFSAGSACNTTNNLPSPVLLAMGKTHAEAEQTIRLSIGKFNTQEDIDKVSRILDKTIRSIRMEK